MKTNLESIQEAYESVIYGNCHIITEEVHPEIQAIMDSEIDPKQKLSAVTKKARQLIKDGQDTGIESDKPKKGSSRAVFFPKEPKKITLDGQETSTSTAIKIAFPGKLDAHHGEPTLLGEDQNEKESDYWVNQTYGVLSRQHDGSYVTNHDGCLAPVFDTHSENHHLEMGRVTRFSAKVLAEHTKNSDFPKGLTVSNMNDALMYQHQMAHGNYTKSGDDPHLEKISEHPYIASIIDMMANTGLHPGDLHGANMGTYEHPITGKKYPVINDWGFTNDINKKYQKARNNLSASIRRTY